MNKSNFKITLKTTLLFFVVGVAPYPPEWDFNFSGGFFFGFIAFLFSSLFFILEKPKKIKSNKKD